MSVYKGFIIHNCRLSGRGWKIMHLDGRGYLLLDFKRLKDAKRFIDKKVR